MAGPWWPFMHTFIYSNHLYISTEIPPEEYLTASIDHELWMKQFIAGVQT